MLLGAFPDWFPYNKIVDFSADWIFQPTGFLIPIPKPMGHLAAIVKPFQFYVIVLFFINCNGLLIGVRISGLDGSVWIDSDCDYCLTFSGTLYGENVTA